MIVQDLLRPLSCFPVRRELSSGDAVVRQIRSPAKSADTVPSINRWSTDRALIGRPKSWIQDFGREAKILNSRFWKAKMLNSRFWKAKILNSGFWQYQGFVRPKSWIQDFGSTKSWIQDFVRPKSWIQDFGSTKSWIQDFVRPKSWIQDFATLTPRYNSMKITLIVAVPFVSESNVK